MTLTSPSRIYLLRHAKASWAQPGQRDFDRPLDNSGYAEAEFIAEKAVDKAYRPARIISSTALRCRQTAETIRRVIDENLDIDFVDELYNGPIDVYRQLIFRSGSAPVMLVGHNPTIEEVVEDLAGKQQTVAAIPRGYPTAGLAVLDRLETPATRHWQLTDFLTA